ncbi:MAG: WD40 repeat domain-containing protein [Planctomycetota bacterium]
MTKPKKPGKPSKKSSDAAKAIVASTTGLPPHALLRIEVPHEGPLLDVTFLADDGFVTGSEDSIRSWSPAGEPRASWGNGGGLGHSAVSRDGLLAFVEKDTIKIHTLATGDKMETFEAREPGAIAFSPDGRILAYSSGEKLMVRDIAKQRDKGAKGGLFKGGITFSDDGRHVRYGFAFFSVKDGKFLENPPPGAVFPPDEESVRVPDELRAPIAVAPGGRHIAGATNETAVGLYAIPARKRVALFEGHAQTVEKLAFSRDGKRLATADAAKVVVIWDVAASLANTQSQG